MTDTELEQYIGLYAKNVYSAALCQLKNPQDADDITQDTFLALYTYSGSFESSEHVKAWLIRCAINKSINLLRSHWYRFSSPLESAEERAYYDEHDTGDLLRTVMKLGRKNRTVLYMHYYEGYEISEIAKIFGISESAVKSRLMRGRKQLGRLITDERSENNELQRNL